MIASDAFEAYQKATGAQMDENTGLLTVSEDQYKKMQNMVFNIGASMRTSAPAISLTSS